jgi:hypothetical protein
MYLLSAHSDRAHNSARDQTPIAAKWNTATAELIVDDGSSRTASDRESRNQRMPRAPRARQSRLLTNRASLDYGRAYRNIRSRGVWFPMGAGPAFTSPKSPGGPLSPK